MSDLQKEIELSKVIVHPGRYAYLKTDKQILGDHFLISKDDDEVTIVTKESNIVSVDFSEETKWFKLFEIRPHMPFLTVGFIATITQAIADKGLNVLVVSTYSKDYILIKDEDTNEAIEALKRLGFQIKEQ